MPPKELPRLLNVRQCAEALCTTVGNLQQWRFHKVGPPWRKVGCRVMYLVEDIRDFIEGVPKR